MEFRLHHVSIPRGPGSDAVTRDFYGGVLGLEEIPAAASVMYLDVLWFKLGAGSELHVFADASLDASSFRHFCLLVEDLAAAWARLEMAGYAPYEGDDIPGRPRFFCRDPFGNLIEFLTITGDYLALQGSDQ